MIFLLLNLRVHLGFPRFHLRSRLFGLEGQREEGKYEARNAVFGRVGIAVRVGGVSRPFILEMCVDSEGEIMKRR